MIPIRAQRFPHGDSIKIPGPAGKVKQWGMPWHGLLKNGVFDPAPSGLPAALASTLLSRWDLALDGMGRNETFNLRSAFRYKIPGHTFTPDSDTAAWLASNGGELRDNAIIIGQDSVLYGVNQLSGWLYADPSGQTWRITPNQLSIGFTDISGVRHYAATSSATFTAKKFGMIRSTHTRQVADTAIPDPTFGPVTFDTDLGNFVFPITITSSAELVDRAFLGSVNEDGSKAVFNTGSPGSLSDSTGTINNINFSSTNSGFVANSGGFPATQTLFGRFADVNAAWLVEMSGTPGVDWNVTISLINTKNVLPIAPPSSSGSGTVTTTQNYDYFIHAWVTPGGTVEQIKFNFDYLQVSVDATTPSPPFRTGNATVTADLTLTVTMGSASTTSTSHWQTSIDFFINPSPPTYSYHSVTTSDFNGAGDINQDVTVSGNSPGVDFIDPYPPSASPLAVQDLFYPVPSSAQAWLFALPTDPAAIRGGGGFDSVLPTAVWFLAGTLGSGSTGQPASDSTALRYRVAQDPETGTQTVYDAGVIPTIHTNETWFYL